MFKDLNLLVNFAIKFFKLKLIYLQLLIILSSITQLLSIFSFGPLILLLMDNKEIKKYKEYYFDKVSDEQFFNNYYSNNNFIYIFKSTSIIFQKNHYILAKKLE